MTIHDLVNTILATKVSTACWWTLGIVVAFIVAMSLLAFLHWWFFE